MEAHCVVDLPKLTRSGFLHFLFIFSNRKFPILYASVMQKQTFSDIDKVIYSLEMRYRSSLGNDLQA